jgi:hypothetical protein
MIQRVIGVFAALAIMGTAACSSSSTTVVQKTDSGTDTKVDGNTDAKSDTTPAETGVICAPAAGANADCTTGKACTTVDDCDLTGNGIGHCTASGLYTVGPLDPTPVCIGLDPSGGDACDPGTIDTATGEQTQLVFCDNGLGRCTETPQNKKATAASCDPFCAIDSSGKFVNTCAGKNSCAPDVLGTDSSGKNVLIGGCFGGCSADSDCPANSKCDSLEKICVGVKCTADAACKTAWSTGPAAWKCETSSGYCKFLYGKVPGDTCNPDATTDECLCFGKKGSGKGVCTELCKTGAASDCRLAGTVCDPLLNSTDSSGKALFDPTFALPAGVNGYCVKKCTTATDCASGEVCEQSAGMGTQKTCRPAA